MKSPFGSNFINYGQHYDGGVLDEILQSCEDLLGKSRAEAKKKAEADHTFIGAVCSAITVSRKSVAAKTAPVVRSVCTKPVAAAAAALTRTLRPQAVLSGAAPRTVFVQSTGFPVKEAMSEVEKVQRGIIRKDPKDMTDEEFPF